MNERCRPSVFKVEIEFKNQILWGRLILIFGLMYMKWDSLHLLPLKLEGFLAISVTQSVARPVG